FIYQSISSKQDLEIYKQLAVEDHIHNVIIELYKIPSACEEFYSDSRVWFDNHANALDGDDEIDASQPSTTKPDQSCMIHRVMRPRVPCSLRSKSGCRRD
ncbi:uncharacterized protein BP01DRAFT_308549, partial [Aspergillus saccharolyticus JOP 1030-1]